jgi:SpoVK/Ycf46/Vps4 family AAA+-type ATPase
MSRKDHIVSFGTKIIPRCSWADLVLPISKKEQLRQLLISAKRHAETLKIGNFEKHSSKTGLKILFSGPSKDGKTMAAEIIASELKLDLWKIDLSMVVNEYVKETEKNLDRIFKDTEEMNGILLFDEADALFGKRSEVKDSHDRYANIEINYLLQKIEEHQGIVILAANIRKNIDAAFLRRMNFIVEFPFPKGH